ncbi:MAG: hypothetical protein LBT41_03100 [Candidatus Methanoplasma sp.]|nr:hypothetical protein [Candidatus Methanoplasma sp.]
MGNTFENGKLTGAVGISAAVVFIVALVAAIFTTDGYDIGTSLIGDLFNGESEIMTYGSVAAGILGVAFGLLAAIVKIGPKTFIGKVRGILIAAAGAALALFAFTEGETELYIWLFAALALLAAVSDAAYNWVVDQKVLLVISAMLLVILAVTAYVHFGTDNIIGGLVFAAFSAIWVIFTAAIFFAPFEAEEPAKKKTKAGNASETKKNGPVARPYQAKTESKKIEAKKEEPKKEEPKKAEAKKEESKKAEAKLKVMSSRDANAARSTAIKKEEPKTPEPEPEPVIVAEPAAEPEPEPVIVAEPAAEPEPEPVIVAEPAGEPDEEYGAADEESEEYADFEIAEDTPEALVRRAAWNKKLRCRRDYGPYQIPIAFVRGKVAVYVGSETGDASSDAVLRDEGWTVLRYLESDITDGKQQGEEISKAVKDNLKADRAKKKSKK